MRNNSENLKNVVTPYGESSSKKEQVAKMFDNISGKYDFLNHFLSMGIDISWRRKAIEILKPLNPKIVIDIATGTGDFAIEAAKQFKAEKIYGVDISEGMLKVGREKIEKIKLSNLIDMKLGDSENLPFEDNFADAITVGFGVRNFEHLEIGMSEIYRVLKPGGKVTILEPAIPTRFPMNFLFKIYFKGILPVLGMLVSRDKAAYTYLPKSVEAFPNGEDFLTICKSVGFKDNQWKPLTFGICSLYVLSK